MKELNEGETLERSALKSGMSENTARFDHLVYHFVLPYSRWETGMVCFSESYETLIGAVHTTLSKSGSAAGPMSST